MTINTISTLPTAPARTDAPATFVTRADAFLAALVVMQGELNTSIGQMNTDIATINSVEPAASVALASANFKGNWSDLTGALNIPAAVRHSDANWILLEDLPDVTASEPSAGNTDWAIIESLPSQAGNSGKYLTTDGSVASWADVSADPTLGTLNKTFIVNEQATISLSSAVTDGVPVVSVTKEVPQTGVINDLMELNVENTYFERQNSAPDTTLDFVDSNRLDSNTLQPYGDQFLITTISSTYGLEFNSTGTKMFILDFGIDLVVEYNLSVAWDVTTATTSGSDFNLSGFDSSPTALAFNPSGTIMYMGGQSADSIYSFSLSPPFDVSTASFTGSFVLSPVLTQPLGINFNADGTKVYISDNGNKLHVFNLGTAYNITTMTYSEDITLPSTSRAARFNSDGTQFIFIDSSEIYFLNLTNPYDFSSYELLSKQALTSTNTYGLALGNSDSYLYEGRTNRVYQRDISKFKKLSLGTGSFVSDDIGNTIEANDGVFTLANTGGDIKTITAPSSYSQAASGEWFKYKVRYNGSALQLSGSVPDITQYSYAGSKLLSAQSNPDDFKWSTDGTKGFTLGENDLIYEYTASPAFDLESLTYTGVSFDVTGQTSNAKYLVFNNDGSKFYILSTSTEDSVYQYSMGSAFNLATAFYDSVSFKVPNEIAGALSPSSLLFNNDGTKMFIFDSTTDAMYEYDLLTPSDISTRQYSQAYYFDDNGLDYATFNDDGSKLYMFDTSSPQPVYQYTLTKPFNVSSIIYDGISSTLATGADNIYYANGNFYFPYSNSVNYYSSLAPSYIPSGAQFAMSQLPIDTTYWSDINSIAAFSSENVYFCYSKDSRTTWSVIDNTDGERDIVRNNAGTWQYNSDATYGSESWTNASLNTEFDALSESTSVAANKMTAPQLRAVTDANNIVLTNDLNFAFGFESESVYRLPLTDGVAINYDANVLNEGALIGIDYDFDFPATDKVRITAINAGNYKVRVL